MCRFKLYNKIMYRQLIKIVKLYDIAFQTNLKSSSYIDVLLNN